MAARETIVAVRDEGRAGATGNTRSLLISVSQPEGSNRWENVTIQRNAGYDEGLGSDFTLAANIYSGNALLLGGTWDDLAGDGQQFDATPAAGGEISIDVFAQLGGAQPTRGTRIPAGSLQRPVTSAVDAPRVYSLTIAEDGYFLPGAQVANYEASLRPLAAPTDFVSYYTNVDEVATILRAAQNRESGFRSNFLARIQRAISAAERRIDGYCGVSFRPAGGAETREYLVSTPLLLELDDLDMTQAVAVSYDDNTIPEGNYDIKRLGVERNVGRYLKPRPREWSPAPGRFVSVNAWFGWPSIPPEVADYAGRLAAQIFDDDAARHGLSGSGDGLAYSRKPGSDIKHALRHLRKGGII